MECPPQEVLLYTLHLKHDVYDSRKIFFQKARRLSHLCTSMCGTYPRNVLKRIQALWTRIYIDKFLYTVTLLSISSKEVSEVLLVLLDNFHKHFREEKQNPIFVFQYCTVINLLNAVVTLVERNLHFYEAHQSYYR